MNPYDFVRINWNNGVKRRQYTPHDHFEGISGRLTGEIKTLTPLFIPDPNYASPKVFLTNHLGHIIPASSIKGLIRNLVETVGYGCWWLFKGEHANKLPYEFKQCSDLNKLCVACRMFGLINSGTLLLGHVSFEDAICKEPTDYPALYTIILSNPKTRHTAFYLDPAEKHVAGRKFYFHHSTPPIDMNRWLPPGAQANQRQNQYIQPIGPESVFSFSAQFNNLAEDELQLLLYALVIESGMRHKIGYAKPAGLGSVEIRLTYLETIDYRQRYKPAGQGKVIYEGEALTDYLANQIRPYVDDKTSITLQDLRRIWAWPGRDDLRYPGWDWFQENPQARLDETP